MLDRAERTVNLTNETNLIKSAFAVPVHNMSSHVIPSIASMHADSSVMFIRCPQVTC